MSGVIWANFTNADSGLLSEWPTMSPGFVNSISGMTNRINFYNNVPSVLQMEQEARVLDEKAPTAINAAREVQRLLLQQDDDIVISLFKTRVEIERVLRIPKTMLN